MSIRDEIKAMSIAALKARDAETRSRLGGILSRFGEVEKGKGFDGWSEERERAVVASYVKQLKGALGDMAARSRSTSWRRSCPSSWTRRPPASWWPPWPSRRGRSASSWGW